MDPPPIGYYNPGDYLMPGEDKPPRDLANIVSWFSFTNRRNWRRKQGNYSSRCRNVVAF
jgi:hypothetical protein